MGKKTEKMPGGLGKWEWRDYKRMREGESKGICSDVEEIQVLGDQDCRPDISKPLLLEIQFSVLD